MVIFSFPFIRKLVCEVNIMTKEHATKLIVKFWRNTLEFEEVCSNGATDKVNVLTNTLASLSHLRQICSITNEQLDNFEKNLTECIELKIAAGVSSVYNDVDYNPDKMLRDSATRAGIDVNMSTFPFKTNTQLDKTSEDDWIPSVKNGYQKEWLDLTDEMFTPEGKFIDPSRKEI